MRVALRLRVLMEVYRAERTERQENDGETWKELQDNGERSREIERVGEMEKNKTRGEQLGMESKERLKIWREVVMENTGDGEN